MQRIVTVVLVAVLAAPSLAAAQWLRPHRAPRVVVAPFLGFVAPYEAEYRQFTAVRGFPAARIDVKTRVTSAVAIGGTARLAVHGPFGVIAGVTRSEHDFSQTTFPGQPGAGADRGAGSTLLIVKAGLAVQLPDEPAGLAANPASVSLTLAPVWIRESFFPEPDVRLDVQKPINHWGLGFGAEAFKPFGRDSRFGAFVAFEDHLVFWNANELERRIDLFIREGTGLDTVTELNFELTHLVVLRAGLSVLF